MKDKIIEILNEVADEFKLVLLSEEIVDIATRIASLYSEVSIKGWTRESLLDVVKGSMSSNGFNAEMIVDAIISISHPTPISEKKLDMGAPYNAADYRARGQLPPQPISEERIEELVNNHLDEEPLTFDEEIGYRMGFKAALKELKLCIEK